MLITASPFKFDTLSIIPASFRLDGLDADQYAVDFGSATITILDTELVFPIPVQLNYQSFPFDFSKKYQHKSTNLITESGAVYNPFRSESKTGSNPLSELNDLEKRGSISRGVGLGTSQNLSINSSLNLQLSGRLNDQYQLVAAIADDNIPVQPDGNTQQLQDFDQVYIQVNSDRNHFTAGDFQITHNRGYFMQFNKKLQGARAQTAFFSIGGDSSKTLTLEASAAVSRGKFARKTIQGIEGNQGPYRLEGAEGERFIVVLSGTERIYLDGRLLTRGQENDYIINYNTAELTFTAKVPITKDRRIVVEYQYSDRNYARSMVYSNASYRDEKLALNLGIYSEQDAKNQPLQQSLTDVQKGVLTSIGDSLNQAFASSVDTATYSANRLLYIKKDTAYFDPILQDSVIIRDILEFNNNDEQTHYQASFSEVGAGKGNYILADQLALGKVYRWVAPLGGVAQGTHEPVIFLVTPKMRQMVSISSEVKLTDNVLVKAELAGTNSDLNTFSPIGNNDNLGIAAKANISGSQRISGDWKALAAIDYELVNRHFKEVERFRSVEFDRDWNIRDIVIQDDQNVIGAQLGAAYGPKFKSIYGVKSFQAGNAFTGIQNSADVMSDFQNLKGTFNASLTKQQGEKINSNYYQHNTLLSIPFWKLQLGYKDDYEDNRKYNPNSDTLALGSFQWWEWEASLATADSAKNRQRFSYAERTDRLKNGLSLSKATFARIYGYELGLNKNQYSQLGIRVNYRTLEIVNAEITPQKNENTLISRIDYGLRLWKGAVVSNTFYEIGSGLENRREYIYIETATGQGTHIFIDYNSNGQKELNEFELAVQSDQIATANFLKVYVPTTDYQKVFTNQFSQSLIVRPAAVWRAKSGALNFISRFTNQFTFAADRKTLRLPFPDQFNPFLFSINDSLLQSTNANLRNIFYFNQSNPIFGADLNYQLLEGRNLLTNGFESRRQEKTSLGVRWNFTSGIGLELRPEQGFKTLSSDAGALASRNYRVFYQQVEPKLSIQPGNRWRLSLLFNYKEQQNLVEQQNTLSSGERAVLRRTGLEFTLSNPEKGNLVFTGALVTITYNGIATSAVGYEMLEGLQPGVNGTWGVSYQRTLANNLQISLNYNGRQSPGLNTIHTGGLQARAFF